MRPSLPGVDLLAASDTVVNPAWYDYWRLALLGPTIIIAMLVIKLLLTKHRGERLPRICYPFRGNTPMYLGLLALLISSAIARARNVQESEPPNIGQLLVVTIAMLLIIVWLWKNLEILPDWLRGHRPHRNRGGHRDTTAGRGPSDARA